MSSVGCSIRALAALERLLTSVKTVKVHVPLQISSRESSIRALAALERPLASVRAHVLI